MMTILYCNSVNAYTCTELDDKLTILTGGPVIGGGVEDQSVEVPLPGEAQADEEEGGPGVHAPCRPVPCARGCPTQRSNSTR